jgi:hypothetical protein
MYRNRTQNVFFFTALALQFYLLINYFLLSSFTTAITLARFYYTT